MTYEVWEDLNVSHYSASFLGDAIATDDKLNNKSKYGPGPHVAVDIVVICRDKKYIHGSKVLLIKRQDGTWALPGGFVDPDDISLEMAARRELEEETTLVLENRLFTELKPRTKKCRDPRSWVISFPFMVTVYTELDIKGQDDALEAKWVYIDKALEMSLFLDHKAIIDSCDFSRI